MSREWRHRCGTLYTYLGEYHVRRGQIPRALLCFERATAALVTTLSDAYLDVARPGRGAPTLTDFTREHNCSQILAETARAWVQWVSVSQVATTVLVVPPLPASTTLRVLASHLKGTDMTRMSSLVERGDHTPFGKKLSCQWVWPCAE
jgi:hypothetical protein